MKELAPKHYHPPAVAVGDAMMVTMDYLVTSYMREQNIKSIPHGDMDDVLHKALDRKCGKGSIYSLYFLTKNYPNMFDKMALIGTYKETSLAHPQTHPLRNPFWKHHAYFLVRDTTGLYYAGSPANYLKSDNDEQLKPIVSYNLQQVLQEIEQKDGGVWTTAQSIEEILDNDYTPANINFRNELGKSVLTFTQIERTPMEEKKFTPVSFIV